MNLVVVLTIILSLSGQTAKIDKGLIDGLRLGDEGTVFYTLTVSGAKPRRITVGRVEVLTANDFEAIVKVSDPLAVKPGYSIEFLVPEDRFSSDTLLRIANLRIDEDQPETALRYLERIGSMLPRAQQAEQKARAKIAKREQQGRLEKDRSRAQKLIAAGKLDEAGPLVAAILSAQPGDPLGPELEAAVAQKRKHDGMVMIPSGIYWIGIDKEAKFFNQRPRFQVRLDAFWIDSRPIMLPELTYDAAEAHCRKLGKRLPTEFEWETALQQPGVVAEKGFGEWTSSWYAPYPGNPIWEANYGEKAKVVREWPDIRRRTFMPPTQSAKDTILRCACN
ncbi:MAG: formylglycine-generating enzyme family protein [Acidobacteriota bacterium]